MSQRHWLAACATMLCAILCTLASSASASGTYVLFDPPGSVKTEGLAINTSGQVAGDFIDGGGNANCFLRSADGVSYQPFTVDGSLNCAASSINDDGVITGRVAFDANDQCVRVEKGFVRAPDGKAKVFGYTASPSNFAFATAINKRGNIVGYYRDDSTGDCDFRGFFRDKKTGTLTDIPVKGAQDIYANGLNNSDFVTGDLVDFDQVTHGFVKREKATTGKKCSKSCQEFDIPGSDKNGNRATPLGINSTNDTTGYFTDPEGLNHGFIRFSNGTSTQVDDPNSGTQPQRGTFPLSINDSEAVAGYYYDKDSGSIRGFVYAAGAFTDIDCPGASLTQPHSINASGQVTGQCQTDADNIVHGFVYTP